VPLNGDKRFCVDCAIKACEEKLPPPFKAGERLVAIGGNRTVDVVEREGTLWVVPVLKDGMPECTLQEWLDVLMKGAERVDRIDLIDGRG